jgi:hypothetical protein
MEDTSIVSYKKHYGEDIAIIVMLYLVIFLIAAVMIYAGYPKEEAKELISKVFSMAKIIGVINIVIIISICEIKCNILARKFEKRINRIEKIIDDIKYYNNITKLYETEKFEPQKEIYKRKLMSGLDINGYDLDNYRDIDRLQNNLHKKVKRLWKYALYINRVERFMFENRKIANKNTVKEVLDVIDNCINNIEKADVNCNLALLEDFLTRSE